MYVPYAVGMLDKIFDITSAPVSDEVLFRGDSWLSFVHDAVWLGVPCTTQSRLTT